jgi:hypothetical protein
MSPDGTMTPDAAATAARLLESRKSIHDLVRDDLAELIRNPRLSSKDKERLQMHHDGIRDVEIDIDDMAGETVERCSTEGLDLTRLEALQSGLAFKSDGLIEDLGKLHMSLVALAFACNHNRTATLQWGDGTDQTLYDVPANATLRWKYHHLSHGVQSDGQTGNEPLAVTACEEIDRLRLESFAAGLDPFAARGLADQCFVLWTNHMADGKLHTYRNIPTIIWGNGGGFLKQAEYVDSGTAGNNQLLNTLISAAVQDTGTVVEDFGEGTPGMLEAIRI